MLKPRKFVVLLAATGVSLVSAVGLSAQPAGGQAAPQPLEPPALLVGLMDREASGDEARRLMTWDQVSASVEPADIAAAQPPAALTQLGDEALRLIDRADEALSLGEAFRAVQLLREAQMLSPNHAQVLRRLGMAYTQAGNDLRAMVYLRRAYHLNPNDTRSLVLMSMHSGGFGELDEAIAWCGAAKQAGYPVIADYYLHEALLRFGYDAAAADRMNAALQAAQDVDVQELAEDDAVDPVIVAELRVLQAMRNELLLQQGDLLISLGRSEQAAQAYGQVAVLEAADPGAVAARLTYVALLADEKEDAIDIVMSLLGTDAAKQRDADLVGYLVERGVDREALSERLRDLMDDHGPSLPILAGLVQVSEQDLVIEVAQQTLAERDGDPQLYEDILGLITYDDQDPETARPLADLLAIGAAQIRANRELAEPYTQAVLDKVDAQVCLLRALMHPDFVDEDDVYRQLLAGMLYDRVSRYAGALRCYERVVELDPGYTEQLRVPMADLMVTVGRVNEALALIGEPGMESDWETVEVYALALLISGKQVEAGNFLDSWQRTRGEDNRAGILRAQFSAWVGDPQDACRRLLRMINVTPKDEELYAVAFELISSYKDYFHTEHLANNNYRLFLNLVRRNLPGSITDRVEHARYMPRDPGFFGNPPNIMELAESQLLSALSEEPDNVYAIWSLIQLYEELGDTEKSSQMFDRYVAVSEHNLQRELIRARRAIDQGDDDMAVQILQRVLALEEEGVMPGREMDGDDAWSVLMLLSTADPELDLEAQSLAMLRRFPNNSLINNGIGYQWSVENRNLLQAREMIRRAIEFGGEDPSLLDSMAWVCYKLGDFDQAQAYQERAIIGLQRLGEMDGSRAVLHDHMGDILYRQGDAAGARRMWNIANDVRLTPDEMRRDPECATMSQRLNAKLDALDAGLEPPVAEVPGPESHGPPGHPADPPVDPQDPPEGAENGPQAPDLNGPQPDPQAELQPAEQAP